MSRFDRLLAWLERQSDLLSPIVVKEVRQIVRGREFTYSFGASLVAGVAVAFGGAAEALAGTGTAGRWTFSALMGCLAVLGLVVVPLGAFSAFRLERMEQTLDLITLTALTPRRVVIGKLLAQGVKLATLFAGVAPFIAMSFLLGGIDFATILVSLAVLLMFSMWVSAACLFLSALLKSRALAALVFGGAAILLFVVLTFGRYVLFAVSRGASFHAALGAPSSSDAWWALAMLTTICFVTLVNLILLAENRLLLPTENRVTPLRIGFLVQFLLVIGWALTFINETPPVKEGVVAALGVLGGVHLAIVAMFTVTEDLIVPRRALLRTVAPSRWDFLRPILHPGGGRGALYVLTQMIVLLCAAVLLDAAWVQVRWLLAVCGYICFFTGVPAISVRAFNPAGTASLKLRVAVLMLLPISMLLPDILHYLLWQPETLRLDFSARHLFNPVRTLANWSRVESLDWVSVPFTLGLIGLLAYVPLIRLGRDVAAEIAPADRQGSGAEAREPGSADVIY